MAKLILIGVFLGVVTMVVVELVLGYFGQELGILKWVFSRLYFLINYFLCALRGGNFKWVYLKGWGGRIMQCVFN